MAHEPGGTVEQYRERLRKADGRTSRFTPLGMLIPKLAGLFRQDPDWGIYREAVERWETLFRPVPEPLDDTGRLNPVFVEWMMGLDRGWVTDTGVLRTQTLKILGSGVVPLQAVAALQTLMVDRRTRDW